MKNNREGARFKPLNGSGLPIFQQRRTNYDLFYAPGFLGVVPLEQVHSFKRELGGGVPPSPVAGQLREYAHQAQARRTELLHEPFKPVCLTLYLHNECNLACSYCFAGATLKPAARLDLTAIRAAANLVMDNCEERGKQFTVVFHGGGEPTLHQEILAETVETVERMASQRRLPIFRYIATNGVLSTKQAAWMASRFDLVGLSCDGPPDIQDRQRPAWNGKGSSAVVERTAKIIHENGTALHVRVTVTPETAARQREIATYICKTFRPREIHVEPVYFGGRAGEDSLFAAEKAGQFVDAFLSAADEARAHNSGWSTSGSRPQEIHGPYCHIFRDVLNVVPGGAATACFAVTDEVTTTELDLEIGRMNGRGFTLHQERIQVIRRRAGIWHKPHNAWIDQCQACFNQYHCTFGCPSVCPLKNNLQDGEFFCHVARRLSETRLSRQADALWVSAKDRTQPLGQKVARA